MKHQVNITFQERDLPLLEELKSEAARERRSLAAQVRQILSERYKSAPQDHQKKIS